MHVYIYDYFLSQRKHDSLLAKIETRIKYLNFAVWESFRNAQKIAGIIEKEKSSGSAPLTYKSTAR